MKKTKCKDVRCLYLAEKENQMEKDFSILTKETREGSGLWEKCNICGISVNRTGVEKDVVKEFYNKNYQKENSLETGQQLSAREHFESRKLTVKKIADKLLPNLNSSMNVYELGAGAGELLFYLKDKVKYCEGNEINETYSNFIQNELKIRCTRKNFLGEKFENKFDMIISICTIDHIYETRKILEKIYNDLNTGGLFYVEVPNDDQILNKYLSPAYANPFSKFMYQKAHYYSFTFKTLSSLLKNVGFSIKNEESKQEYTIKNFLNWYFTSQPQRSFNKATSDNKLLNNFNDKLEKKINNLFEKFDDNFNKIVNSNEAGDTICILAQK